jgi:hypothetical protein
MRPARILPALAVAGALLTGCATGPGDAPSTSAGGVSDVGPNPGAPIPAPGQVTGQGTVIQTGDAPPQLCLGPVAESYPPQCSGVELAGWDWAAVEGEETSGDVTFGAYAVTGTWDGTTLTTSGAIMLALYDPMAFIDPLLDPDNAGDTSEADLTEIQDGLADAPFTVLESHTENGYLFVSVVYDDGRIQDWVDAAYLPDTVAIRPALRDVEG